MGGGGEGLEEHLPASRGEGSGGRKSKIERAREWCTCVLYHRRMCPACRQHFCAGSTVGTCTCVHVHVLVVINGYIMVLC